MLAFLVFPERALPASCTGFSPPSTLHSGEHRSRPWSSLPTVSTSPWAAHTVSISTAYSCWPLCLRPLLTPLPELQACKARLRWTFLLAEAVKKKLLSDPSPQPPLSSHLKAGNERSSFILLAPPLPPVLPPRWVCSYQPLSVPMATTLAQARITSALPHSPLWPLRHHPERSFKSLKQIRYLCLTHQ